ncbi:MAG: hypothetical protein ABI439_14405 [Rhodospirillales bacterium]
MDKIPGEPRNSSPLVFFAIGALVVAVAALAFFTLNGPSNTTPTPVTVVTPPAPSTAAVPPTTDADRDRRDRDRYDRDRSRNDRDRNDRDHNDRDRH